MNEAEVLKQYEGIMVKAACQFYVPGASRDDLLQEARIAALLALRTVDESRGTTAGLVRCAVRRSLLTRIKASRRLCRDASVEVTLSEGDWEVLEGRTSRQKVEDGAVVRCQVEELRRIATPLEWSVVVGVMRGESYRETAARLKITPKSVDNALSRLREKVAREPERWR